MFELEEHLHEDISTLIGTLTNPKRLDTYRIRSIASNIVRKWLIDKQLARLSHALGKTVTLPALDVGPLAGDVERGQVCELFVAGGISLGGYPINSLSLPKRGFPGRLNIPIPKYRLFSVPKFLGRKCTYFKGQWITCEQLLRYAANKAGGVHFDPNNRKDKDLLIAEAHERYRIISTNNKKTLSEKIEIRVARACGQSP